MRRGAQFARKRESTPRACLDRTAAPSGTLLADRPRKRVLNELAGVSERELLFDVSLIRLNGFHTDVQLISDLPRPVTRADEPKPCKHEIAQFRRGMALGGGRAVNELPKHSFCQPIAQINFPVENSAY